MRTFKFKAVSVAISMALALALPFGVMAADFSDGEEWDAEWDAEASADFDEPLPADAGVQEDAFEFVEADAFVGDAPTSTIADSLTIKNVQFYYGDPGHDDYDVTYDLVYKDNPETTYGSYELDKAAVDMEGSHVPAGCETYGTFRMKVFITDWPNRDREDLYWISEDLTIETEPPLHHSWTEKKVVDHRDATCTSDGYSKIDWICDRCGATFEAYYNEPALTLTTEEKELYKHLEQVHLAPRHDYKDEVYYMDTDADGKPTGDLLTKAPDSEVYYKITASVCQNVKNAKVTTCEAPVESVTVERVPNDATVDISDCVNIAKSADAAKHEYNHKAKEYAVYQEDIVGKDVVYPYTFKLEDIELVDCAIDGSFVLTFNHYQDYRKFTLAENDYDATFEVVAIDENLTKEEEIKENAEKAAKTVTKLVELINKVEPDTKTTEKVIVPAHHTLEYKYTMTDTKLVGTVDDYIVFEKDGKVYNNDQVKVAGNYFVAAELLSIKASRYCVPFNVDVEAYCVCEKHAGKTRLVSNDTVEAPATPDAHLVDKLTKNAIDNNDKDGSNIDVALGNLITKDNGVDLNEYESFMKSHSKYVKEISNTATCTKLGEAKVQYICTLCGADTATATIKINKWANENGYSHNYESKREDVVESTCSVSGSFMSVQVCSRCGDRKEIGKVFMKKVPHKYSTTPVVKWEGELIVDKTPESLLNMKGEDVALNLVGIPAQGADGTGVSNYTVKPTLCVACEVCGHTEPIEDIDALLHIDDIKKEGKFCEQGEIVLTAKARSEKSPVKVKNNGYTEDEYTKIKVGTDYNTLTGTFPYYSSMSAYQGRTAHTYGDPVIENVVPATETAAGSHDLVVYCKICGLEAYRRTLVDAPIDHVHKLNKVEAKEATCEEPGNIEYWVCEGENCGAFFKDADGKEQITQEETVVAATGHNLEPVEAKEPTCVPGKVAHYICTNCTRMFKDAEAKEEVFLEEVTLPATEEHIPKEPVVETFEDGKYSVVYCDRCGDILSKEPYVEPVLLPGPKTFNLKANKPNAGYMEFKLGEVEGAEKYRVSYRIAGTKPYTRQESDTNVVKITDLERGQVYDFTACAGDVLEDGQIQWGARALRKDGAVKYARRWYETVEQSKIAKKDNVITLEWTFLNDASKYEISIADNKAMDKAVTVDAAMFYPQIVGDKVQVTIDITALPNADKVPAGAKIKFYVRIRPYTLYDGKDVAGGVSNLRAKTIKF